MFHTGPSFRSFRTLYPMIALNLLDKCMALVLVHFSITIPDVVYVINGGKTKEKVW